MVVKGLFEFEKGQVVPSWLYRVRDAGAEEDVPCTFGTQGRCAQMEDRSIWLWPGADKRPDEYIFAIENGTYTNASAWHPEGDELLNVLPSLEAARGVLGNVVDSASLPLPEEDPRPVV